MAAVATVIVLLLGGVLIGLALFLALRWWVVNVEVGEDKSRIARPAEVAQVAFIIPYLILLMWFWTGNDRIAASVFLVITVVANVLAVRYLKRDTPSGRSNRG